MKRALYVGVAVIALAAATLHYRFAMPLNDTLNGAFEWCGALFISQSIIALTKAKLVRGVSWTHVAFFSSWGFWNIFYYASLNQWVSWCGGIFLVSANTFWLGQLGYYLWKEQCQPA